MGSFGGLRNWLFLAVVGLLLMLGGAVIQDSRSRIEKNETAIIEIRGAHEKDLRELRERWNTEYQGILQTQGQNGERLGKAETEIRVSHEEIIGRLDRIDATISNKIH